MKKTAIAFAVALAGFATVAQATPKDDTWYTGAKLGWSQYQHYGIEDFNNGPIHNSQLGAGAFVGYQATQHLGFELGYDWLGRMAYKGEGDNGAFKAQGVQLTTKLSYPINSDLDVYTRLGGMIWRADASTQSSKENDTGVSPLIAVGAEYALNQNWATRLDYQWVHGIGDKGNLGVKPNNGMLSVGLSYRFGQGQTVAPVVAAAEQKPVVEIKKFTLTSDVLFHFNQATLKAEGKQALDQLYDQLSALDPQDGSVIVLGYTDAVGSAKYNHRLSEERAKNVVHYLVSKGIPADKISARGMGKANPVTGTKCGYHSGRATAAQISCLAPDRRVEIEVKGEKQQTVSQDEAQSQAQ